MPARHAMERKAGRRAVRAADADKRLVRRFGLYHFDRQLIGQAGQFLHIGFQFRRNRTVVQIQTQPQRGRHLVKHRMKLRQHIG